MRVSLPTPTLDPKDQEPETLLACTIWGEARNQSATGMLAVAHVVLNRCMAEGKMIKEIVLAPKQFSCWNDADSVKRLLNPMDYDKQSAWWRAATVAELVLDGRTEDPTRGSRNYFAHKVVTPSWSTPDSGWTTKVVIEDHTFGNSA